MRWQFMVANYAIVEFIALTRCLIDKFTIFFFNRDATFPEISKKREAFFIIFFFYYNMTISTQYSIKHRYNV